MKINGKKSMAVCINGAKEERSWNFDGCEIGEVEDYKYLGVTVKAGLNIQVTCGCNGEGRFEWWF